MPGDDSAQSDSVEHAGRLPGARPRVALLAEAHLPARAGTFRVAAFRVEGMAGEVTALIQGDLTGETPVLTRLHSACMTGDIFGSLRCDCGEQLDAALEMIAAAGRGVLLYPPQEGRGI